MAGVPARIVGTFEEFLKKRLKENIPNEFVPAGQRVSDKAVHYFWKRFYLKHNED